LKKNNAMQSTHSALYAAILAFPLDEANCSFPFSKRLATENGWDGHFTQRVILEYKRFMYLCCISPGPVTPPDAVDQAWHLHLTYTRSYWVDFCQHTLPRPIHHHPTRGGKAEAQKFDSWYTRVQQLYFDSFGELPPPDIWLPNQKRFTDIRFRRVNLNRYWLIPKPRLAFSTKTLLLLLLTVAGTVSIQAAGTAIVWVIVAAVILLIIFLPGGKKNNGSTNDGGTSGCGIAGEGHGHNGDSSGDSGCGGAGCSGCGGD
jgi:hypothetical protein